MPEWTKLTSARVGEQCYRLRHPSGLSIYVWPKPGYKACYATFAARYGSIDTAFMRQGDAAPTVVPAGIAHYLEHKLFESEDTTPFPVMPKPGRLPTPTPVSTVRRICFPVPTASRNPWKSCSILSSPPISPRRR